ncbi:hypothetical protein OG612_09600 [Streptomyces sp. NBC_01527]|uniref:hypothetical protein n=1 Tax=unclassified Streptomyces TaxID=2593676 RepID=UPI002E12221F|nr:hypothetical protein OG763_34020 [Streptomyces sp. NBC_01230]
MSIGHTLLESGQQHGCDLKRTFHEKFGHGRPLRSDQACSTPSRLPRHGLGLVDTRRAERPRSRHARTGRSRGAEPVGRLSCDRPLFHQEAGLRRLELTEARLDRLREEVAR